MRIHGYNGEHAKDTARGHGRRRQVPAEFRSDDHSCRSRAVFGAVDEHDAVQRFALVDSHIAGGSKLENCTETAGHVAVPSLVSASVREVSKHNCLPWPTVRSGGCSAQQAAVHIWRRADTGGRCAGVGRHQVRRRQVEARETAWQRAPGVASEGGAAAELVVK